MTLDLAAMQPALKQRYPAWKVLDMVYKKNPLLGMIPKDETFTGELTKIPTIYGNPQSRSAVFATAQTESSTANSKLAAFLITRKKDYGVAQIDNETLQASKTDVGAFLRAATLEMDGAINALTRSTAIKLYRGGSGSIGRLSASSGTTTTLTLEDPRQAVNFEVGQFLESGPNDSATGLNTSTGTQGLITALNRSTGVITLQTAITSLAAADYLFPRGDAGAALSGLAAWLPYDNRAAALSASFFGVTRSTDSYRLGGLIYDGTQQPIEEALIDAANLTALEGGSPDYCFLSFPKYAELAKALGTKIQYVTVKPGGDATVSFQGFTINGPTGPITVLPDMNCQTRDFYMLQMDTWELCSLGKIVDVFETDGLSMLRAANSDGVEIRLNQYAQLACRAPGWNCHGRLAA
jgi:hypothetical protein